MPYIVEIAARAGGGGLDFMARISANYCPIKATINIAVGDKPEYLNYVPTGKDTFALCLTSSAGQIDAIHIPENVTNDPEIFMLKIIAAKGDTIKRPPLGNDIIGFLGVMGDSRQETEDKAMRYSQQVVVTTR
ncbi:hypothetical protein D3C71_1823420 [compost metagenome]